MKLTYENTQASPWIIPVFVLSTEKTGRNLYVPKQAQCILDTGNLHGNTISKSFLINVLKYSEQSFQELTYEESHGGIGATGDKLLPEGAIYLTWYHASSATVYRDMRFLISPHAHCDLVVGACSIQEYNILSPPNLATLSNVDPGEIGVLLCNSQYAIIKTNFIRSRGQRKKEKEKLRGRQGSRTVRRR